MCGCHSVLYSTVSERSARCVFVGVGNTYILLTSDNLALQLQILPTGCVYVFGSRLVWGSLVVLIVCESCEVILSIKSVNV